MQRTAEDPGREWVNDTVDELDMAETVAAALKWFNTITHKDMFCTVTDVPRIDQQNHNDTTVPDKPLSVI